MDWTSPLGPSDLLVMRLVFWQRLPVIGRVIRQLLKLMGTDIPPEVLAPGTGLLLPHCGKVTVHHRTRIGRDVTLVQGSTVGVADTWLVGGVGEPEVIEIGDHVVLGAGAVVLCKIGERLTVAPWTVVGANAVLLHSTGPGEIWAGNPARLRGKRDDVVAIAKT